jgi:hypothetical protein
MIDKGFYMNIDELNAELQDLAEQERLSLVEAEYESYMDRLMAEHNMRMYEANSYDEDAIYYGE